MADGGQEAEQKGVTRRAFLKGAVAVGGALVTEGMVGAIGAEAQTATPPPPSGDSNVSRVSALQTAIAGQEKTNAQKTAEAAQKTAVADLEKKATALAESPTSTATATATVTPSSTPTLSPTPDIQATIAARDKAAVAEVADRMETATAKAPTPTTTPTPTATPKPPPASGSKGGGAWGLLWTGMGAVGGFIAGNEAARTRIWNSRPVKWITRRP